MIDIGFQINPNWHAIYYGGFWCCTGLILIRKILTDCYRLHADGEQERQLPPLSLKIIQPSKVIQLIDIAPEYHWIEIR